MTKVNTALFGRLTPLNETIELAKPAASMMVGLPVMKLPSPSVSISNLKSEAWVPLTVNPENSTVKSTEPGSPVRCTFHSLANRKTPRLAGKSVVCSVKAALS